MQAQSARKERAMSVRYHKVKFFGKSHYLRIGSCLYSDDSERQKVVRKIGQTKKKLASTEKSSSLKKKKMENVLFELRVDLNYILVRPVLRQILNAIVQQ